jgi:hypothetical protein
MYFINDPSLPRTTFYEGSTIELKMPTHLDFPDEHTDGEEQEETGEEDREKDKQVDV